MTDSPSARSPARAVPARGSTGLRLRIWFSCLGGVLVLCSGLWWVLGTQAGEEARIDASTLVPWVLAVATLGIIVGACFALWLDRVLITHLRGLANSLASSQVADLRGLPAASGWGELSQLTHQVQLLVTQHRQASRGVEELGLLRQQLAGVASALERWRASERWPGLRIEGAAIAPIADALNQGLRRLDEVREQNQEVARQIGTEISSSLADAREAAEQAERGFVEATALLTTVRELQRLAGELTHAIETASGTEPDAAREVWNAYQTVARSAIEELVESSTSSVEHLARGVVKVQEIADQVHILANRSTLIALQTALGGGAAGPTPEMASDLKMLAAEVRAATEHTARLAREVEQEATAATERMRGVRERVGRKLDRAPALPGQSPRGDAPRLLARVREMVQDATHKGERLSAAGERVSRAAERLVRALDEEAGELNGLVVRLSPPEPRAPEARREPTEPGTPGARPGGLKLLGPDDLLRGSEPPRMRHAPGEERT